MQMIAPARRAFKAFLSEGGSVRLRDYEAASLYAWKTSLSAPAEQILDKQIRMVTWLNRQSKEQYTLFHTDFPGEWPEEVLFPFRSEKTVAQISLHPTGSQASELRCEIELFCGRIFGIRFEGSPRMIFAVKKTFRLGKFVLTRSVMSPEIEVSNVRVFADPMNAKPA